jgi:Tfp pilus assembly protein PilF/TolB-like protein
LLCAWIPILADNFVVLPFFNHSGDASIEWIGESLSETLREALAREGTIALDREARQEAYRRLSIRPYSALTKATVLRIGEFLDADQIVHGRFEFTPPPDGQPKTKGSVRIVGQVVNLRNASQSPEYTEIGSLEDLARLQTHLAWQTVRTVKSRSAPSEEEFWRRHPVIRVEAIESHTRALLTSSPDQKLKLLTQAVRIDPRYSQAHFALGRLYFDRHNWQQAAESLKRVAPEDVHYREANFLLGLCRYNASDFAAAEEAFRQVVSAVPLNEVWNNLGAAQVQLKKADALENFRKALEGDPADPDYHFNVGLALFRAGDLAEAAESFRAVLDRDPADTEAITMLGRSLKKTPQRGTAQSPEPSARIKETFEESAWLQLKAVLEPRRQEGR